MCVRAKQKFWEKKIIHHQKNESSAEKFVYLWNNRKQKFPSSLSWLTQLSSFFGELFYFIAISLEITLRMLMKTNILLLHRVCLSRCCCCYSLNYLLRYFFINWVSQFSIVKHHRKRERERASRSNEVIDRPPRKQEEFVLLALNNKTSSSSLWFSNRWELLSLLLFVIV